jgi:alpha-beta hydrolase superfamily lysophospholipase
MKMNQKKTNVIVRLISVVLVILSLNSAFSNESLDSQSFSNLESQFFDLYKNRMEKIKEGSRPFLLSQHKKAPTVVMFHGLSDSPGSLKEVAKVYYLLGYNVLTVLLRDHGLRKENRDLARLKVRVADWRADIDQVMQVAFLLSDSSKVALAGYSLGGALATDTADRYEGKISSLVYITPLFKMNHQGFAHVAKYLRGLRYLLKKGIDESAHFYPDFTFNQVYQTYLLTKHLRLNVTKLAKNNFKEIPKMMFLTDADLTVENDFALKTAKWIHIPEENIVLYENNDKDRVVLHRDLPMRFINANHRENPFIDDLLVRLESFLETLSTK